MTHVLTVAWTAECLRVLRLREASIRSLGPDDPEAFEAWWQGGVSATPRVTATVVLLDPIERPRAAPWVGLHELGEARPRHAGYAELLRVLRIDGRA